MTRLEWTDPAVADLENIQDYIARNSTFLRLPMARGISLARNPSLGLSDRCILFGRIERLCNFCRIEQHRVETSIGRVAIVVVAHIG
jgi:plasmid stabilization system protein ParE